MGPILGSALIGVAGNLLGSSISDRSNRRAEEESRLFEAGERAADRDLQREFATHGVRWRVDDARSAGLHPLAALGAQVTPYTPLGQSGQTFSGSTKGDAIRASGAALAESIGRSERDKAETRLLNAQADLVTQQAADSTAARLTQDQSAQLADSVLPVDVKPPQLTTHRRMFGNDILSNPGFTDAQSDEDRSGELVSAFKGFLTELADYKYTVEQDFKNFRPRKPPVGEKNMWRYRFLK